MIFPQGKRDYLSLEATTITAHLGDRQILLYEAEDQLDRPMVSRDVLTLSTAKFRRLQNLVIENADLLAVAQDLAAHRRCSSDPADLACGLIHYEELARSAYHADFLTKAEEGALLSIATKKKIHIWEERYSG